MSDPSGLLRAVIGGRDLDEDEASAAIGALIDASYGPVRSAALLAAFATKGESIGELVGAARAMRTRAVPFHHALPLVLDVCGTGGDHQGTISISTAVAFVVAGAGIPVAKHGNRAVSSRCGSADVLDALGVPLDREPEASAALLAAHRIAFLFAPYYHPAMQAVTLIRRELGVPTIFNLLGPLTNPAGTTHQLVGVPDPWRQRLIASALERLGVHAAVVTSASGLDEVAGEGPTDVLHVGPSGIRQTRIDPAEYGIAAPLAALRGGDARVNATALEAILADERSPRADVVALNAALALVLVEAAADLHEGLVLARRSIATGAAAAALAALRTTGDTADRTAPHDAPVGREGYE